MGRKQRLEGGGFGTKTVGGNLGISDRVCPSPPSLRPPPKGAIGKFRCVSVALLHALTGSFPGVDDDVTLAAPHRRSQIGPGGGGEEEQEEEEEEDGVADH